MTPLGVRRNFLGSGKRRELGGPQPLFKDDGAFHIRPPPKSIRRRSKPGQTQAAVTKSTETLHLASLVPEREPPAPVPLRRAFERVDKAIDQAWEAQQIAA